MAAVICDQDVERLIRKRRKATGADRWDEVWDGVYMIMPLPNDEHQEIVSHFNFVFELVIGQVGAGKVRPGVNVSDREADWKKNYRGPEVVVFLEGTTAENRGAYWFGGPDFAVEVMSPGDRAHEKLPFYAKVNVRELLLVARKPWALELYRLQDGELKPAGRSTIEGAEALPSEVLPFAFRLVPGEVRPAIEVCERGGDRQWTV